MNRTFAVLVLSAVVAPSFFVRAQSPPEQKSLAFEVASVKLNTSGPLAPARVQPAGDRLNISNVPLRQLIQMAYQVTTRDDVLSGPGWIDDERYDIVAKGNNEFTSSHPWQPLLETLLKDRFQLAAHLESRASQAIALVALRKDGTLGRGLRRADEDCVGRLRSGGAAPSTNPCGLTTLGNAPITGHITLHGAPINVLLGVISIDAGGVHVTDATGLSGPFDLELVWTPRAYSTANHVEDRRPEVDRIAPELGVALQEQLGLKLESAKSRKDVVVIDHVDRPTPD